MSKGRAPQEVKQKVYGEKEKRTIRQRRQTNDRIIVCGKCARDHQLLSSHCLAGRIMGNLQRSQSRSHSRFAQRRAGKRLRAFRNKRISCGYNKAIKAMPQRLESGEIAHCAYDTIAKRSKAPGGELWPTFANSARQQRPPFCEKTLN